MKRSILIVLLLFISVITSQDLIPKLTVREPSHDFGDILESDHVSHEFVILNSGYAPLIIENVRASCGCTAAMPDKKEIGPGETAKIKVDFNAENRSGLQKKYVYVFTNDPENKDFRLTFTANIKPGGKKELKIVETPKLKLSKLQHNFGEVEEGKKVDYELQVKNVGSGELVIRDIKTSCGCTAAVLDKKVLKENETGKIKIELDTSNRSGKMTRTVVLYTNDPTQPQQIFTIYVNIQKRTS